jgi:hypothetical protein
LTALLSDSWTIRNAAAWTAASGGLRLELGGLTRADAADRAAGLGQGGRGQLGDVRERLRRLTGIAREPALRDPRMERDRRPRGMPPKAYVVRRP